MIKAACIYLIILISILGCSEPTSVTNREDYQKYLEKSNLVLTSLEEINFWKHRLSEMPDDNTSLLKLAGLFSSKFRSNGEVHYVVKSDSLYDFVLNKSVSDKASIHQALATNAISQHKFKDAQHHIQQAITIGDHMATSKLIQVDVEMELGGYDWAEKILDGFTNKNSFAWLIRKAKLQDHQGNLDSAIVLMERAYSRIEGNKSLAVWTLTNLADMYGHDGRTHEAYENYLKALKLDPGNDYALKGIAWIALSNDHKLIEAKQIMNSLLKWKRMPEAHLMLAEIALLQNDDSERIHQLQFFKSMIDKDDYRLMYSKYLATIEAADFKNPRRCIEIAIDEINNRPTPQSYDLLAYGYHMNGENKKALKVVNDHVLDRTFEPESLYHMGLVYKANGFINEGNDLLHEALKSSFELGPSITKSIIEALN